MPSNRIIGLLFALVVICTVGGIWWLRDRPRREATFVDQSTGQRSQFMDDAQCAECHPGRADSHHQSGHADTFRASRDSEAARSLDGKRFVDPERQMTYQYHVDDDGVLSVSVPEQLGDERFPLDYLLGSGHNAISFLSLIPDRLGDTVGIEHRITLYRDDTDWELDLTPGHTGAIADQPIELFGKVVRGDTLTSCVGCHTVTAEISGHQLVDVRPNVGCQSCHGPGGEHATAMREGTSSVTERGYAELTRQTAEEEIALCGRCHRLPSDTPTANASPDIIRNVRFQPAGLIQSPCYIGSQDLRCSTCHDPHEPVSRDTSHYVRRCLDCHGDSSAAHCPVSPRDNCIGCHMPAIDVHRGIEFHDHWIRVRRDVPSEVPTIEPETREGETTEPTSRG